MTHDPIQSWLNAAGRFPLLPKLNDRLARSDTLEPGSRLTSGHQQDLRAQPAPDPWHRPPVFNSVGYTMNDVVP